MAGRSKEPRVLLPQRGNMGMSPAYSTIQIELRHSKEYGQTVICIQSRLFHIYTEHICPSLSIVLSAHRLLHSKQSLSHPLRVDPSALPLIPMVDLETSGLHM